MVHQFYRAWFLLKGQVFIEKDTFGAVYWIEITYLSQFL